MEIKKKVWNGGGFVHLEGTSIEVKTTKENCSRFYSYVFNVGQLYKEKYN